MKQQANNSNILLYAVAGVLLSIATFAITLINSSAATAAHFPKTLAVSILGVSAVSLLYKAIKDDHARLMEERQTIFSE